MNRVPVNFTIAQENLDFSLSSENHGLEDTFKI